MNNAWHKTAHFTIELEAINSFELKMRQQQKQQPKKMPGNVTEMEQLIRLIRSNKCLNCKFPIYWNLCNSQLFWASNSFCTQNSSRAKKGNSNENKVYNLYKLLLFIMYSHMKNNWNLSQFQKVHAFIFTELIFVFIIQSTYLEPFAFFLSLHLFLFCDFSSFFQLFLCVLLSFFACVLYNVYMFT